MNLQLLQEADPETWDAIMLLLAVEYAKDKHLLISEYSVIGRDIIQGCLQRAIERRGWGFQLMRSTGGKCLADISTKSDIVDGKPGDSPAEALLAAYLEAIHES